MFCIAHDITARKQAENVLKEAEARVRLIVESLPIGILIIDAVGVIEFTNPFVRQMFGYSAAELTGQPIVKLFSASGSVLEQAAEFREELFARAQKEIWELDGIKFGGTVFPAEVSMNEFNTAAGNRYLIVIMDVTQKNAIEKMRQEFMAMVSHDLRSPLTSVQTFLDLLEAGICGELNEKGKLKLRSANRNIERLVDLIRDLLDLERFKSGILIVNAVRVPISRIIERSIDTVRLQAEKLNIRIETDVADIHVLADEDRMVQAVVNLLSNSIKFSSSNTAIAVKLKADIDWAEVQIHDQGRGISAEDQARIFERFQQVKDVDADLNMGTGLGLPICKAIIEQHGGSIGVRSEKGKGSCFWFRLPTFIEPTKAEPVQDAT
jgi:PAS domain S-box-containing protein